MNCEPNHHKDGGHIRRFSCGMFHAILAAAFLLGIAGCTFEDPEYAQKLAMVRTNCTGKEIVGVWVSKVDLIPFPSTTIALIRPNGTGILKKTGFMDTPLTWKYAGEGLWNGNTEICADRTLSMRFNGQNLLVEEYLRGATTLHVFVRTDDEAAVNEYMGKRN